MRPDYFACLACAAVALALWPITLYLWGGGQRLRCGPVNAARCAMKRFFRYLKLWLLVPFTLEKIMSAISDFADKMKVHNDHVDIAVAGLQGDVKNLSDQIAALQASAGQVTPEDQALLDGIEARTAAIHDKLDALDALTPPTP